MPATTSFLPTTKGQETAYSIYQTLRNLPLRYTTTDTIDMYGTHIRTYNSTRIPLPEYRTAALAEIAHHYPYLPDDTKPHLDYLITACYRIPDHSSPERTLWETMTGDILAHLRHTLELALGDVPF